MFGRGINLDEDILLKNRISILTEDQEWIKLFGDNNNKHIQDSKESLIQLLTKEKELESYAQEIQSQKIKYMKMILKVSDSLNNEDNKNKEIELELLDGYKEKILQINDEIDDIQFQLETLPKEIRDVNFQLLTATVEYGYNELKSREKVLNKSLEEIDTLREKLKNLMKIKHDNEEWISETYTFLHGLLGSEVIEEIDRKKLK